MSASDLAVKREDTNILSELIASFQHVTDLDDVGESAMWIAVRNGHSEASHGRVLVLYKDSPPS